MKKIFSSQNVSLVNFYKEILEINGIASIVKNYYLTSGIGDLPPNEVVPELWILDDQQYKQAKALLSAEKGPPWQCLCGEKIEGQFEQCWKCGHLRPASS